MNWLVCFLWVVATFANSNTTDHVRPVAPLSRTEARRWSIEVIKEFMAHDIYRHPLMEKISDSSYPDHVSALKFFSQQVYCFARDFRSYLALTLAKLHCCADVKDNLNDHIREENGLLTQAELDHAEKAGIPRGLIGQVPHIDLWSRMMKTLNIPYAWTQEVVRLHEWTVEKTMHESSTVGIVIILAIELWAGSMGVEIIPALRTAGIDPELGIFFDLHALVDTEDHIGEIDLDLISLLTNQIPENSLQELKDTVREMQDIRLILWDKIHEVNMNTPAAPLPERSEGPECYGPKMCKALEDSMVNGNYHHPTAFHKRVLETFVELQDSEVKCTVDM